jgi:hypothetical protein
MRTTRLLRACAVPVVAGLLLLAPSARVTRITSRTAAPASARVAGTSSALGSSANGRTATGTPPRRTWQKAPSTSTATCRAPNDQYGWGYDTAELQ